ARDGGSRWGPRDLIPWPLLLKEKGNEERHPEAPLLQERGWGEVERPQTSRRSLPLHPIPLQDPLRRSRLVHLVGTVVDARAAFVAPPEGERRQFREAEGAVGLDCAVEHAL